VTKSSVARLGDHVPLEAAGVAEVELFQRLSIWKASGADAALAAVGLAGGELALQAGAENCSWLLLREALRLLLDVLRLVRRLAADKTLPRGVRIRLALLLVYLAMPIDLIPDFIPVLGYADDAIIVTAVLRSVVRRAGLAVVRAHWPGTDDGFAALALR
jgi:uncharacterized membrane protein YkvA (DUF1232 family)